MYVSFSLSPSEGGVVIYRAWALLQESLILCMWLTKAQPAFDDLHSLISIFFIHSLKSIIAKVISTLTRCNFTLASPFESYLISNSEIRFSRDKVQFSPDLLVKANLYLCLRDLIT